ncbi:MAG: hypothetical protein V4485_06485 [Pseudomonadota bacterium]
MKSINSFVAKRYTSNQPSHHLTLEQVQERGVFGASLSGLTTAGYEYSAKINSILPKSYKNSQGFHKSNIVFADILFVVSDSVIGVQKTIKIPIRVPSKLIFSLEEGIYEGEKEFDYKEGIHEVIKAVEYHAEGDHGVKEGEINVGKKSLETYQYDDSALSRFHKLNSGIDDVNFQVQTESNYKRQFDNHFKHSENALLMFITSSTVISMIVDQLSRDMGKSFVINEIIFNIHSTREICNHCANGIDGLLDANSKFVNRLQSCLMEASTREKSFTIDRDVELSLNCSYFLSKSKVNQQDYHPLQGIHPSLDALQSNSCFISGSKDKTEFNHYNKSIHDLIKRELGRDFEAFIRQINSESDVFRGKLIASIQKHNKANEVSFTVEQLDSFSLNIMLILEEYIDLLDEEMCDVANIPVRSRRELDASAANPNKVIDIDVELLEGGDLIENLQELFYEILPIAKKCKPLYAWGCYETSLAEYVGFILDKIEIDPEKQELYASLENSGALERSNQPNYKYISELISKHTKYAILPKALDVLVSHQHDSSYLLKMGHKLKIDSLYKTLCRAASAIEEKYPKILELSSIGAQYDEDDESGYVYAFEDMYSTLSEKERLSWGKYEEMESVIQTLSPIISILDQIKFRHLQHENSDEDSQEAGAAAAGGAIAWHTSTADDYEEGVVELGTQSAATTVSDFP